MWTVWTTVCAAIMDVPMSAWIVLQTVQGERIRWYLDLYFLHILQHLLSKLFLMQVCELVTRVVCDEADVEGEDQEFGEEGY